MTATRSLEVIVKGPFQQVPLSMTPVLSGSSRSLPEAIVGGRATDPQRPRIYRVLLSLPAHASFAWSAGDIMLVSDYKWTVGWSSADLIQIY